MQRGDPKTEALEPPLHPTISSGPPLPLCSIAWASLKPSSQQGENLGRLLIDQAE